MFEALACGIPLISAPWTDAERLFPGGSYIKVGSGAEMAAAMRLLMADEALAMDISRAGQRAIAARHTCGHRADQLLSLVDELATPARPRTESREVMPS
jgi:spore maturation protein CgeB